MCELLALAFNKSVSPSFTFAGFRHRADTNPDGWGLACFDGKAAQIYKEPVHGRRSPLADFVAAYERVLSRIFIGHVRWGSVGGYCLANTHPFGREMGGRDWVFAHNGTLRGEFTAFGGSGRYRPVGRTDSESAFCEILNWMCEEGVLTTDYESIERKLREMNTAGNMNVLFSDGGRLYVYRDASGYNGLCILRREAPFGLARLSDEDWCVNLAEQKDPEQRGYVVATSPLTDEAWENLAPASLTVIADGEIVYG